MSKQNNRLRAQADHCRELAQWTSDARTQHILMDLARELETEGNGAPVSSDESPSLPHSLS